MFRQPSLATSTIDTKTHTNSQSYLGCIEDLKLVPIFVGSITQLEMDCGKLSLLRYMNNKEEIIQKVKEYKQSKNYIYEASPEKKKEYARTAYLNKKAKLQKISQDIYLLQLVYQQFFCVHLYY